ncbi:MULTISPECIES: response regulator transcription factor [unclassified Fibrobacter]|uniref:response regulator n=1 Tax=unclassified Fibrobacter TaxID=2634177 RepID=UPI0009152BF2|nr:MULTISPECIES: response regulator transcription factor [unclassified Fibrobacter]MBO6136420.1 response regulator transcription factor [Fibrobacter sp.]SHH49577.1 two-component system, OmpR family, alkaline phosphatase synthesis response regulator PhoP [Fibrobacter sp. UWCM]
MIYIVEDNSEIREMEAYALKSSGFEVNAFDCGKSLDEAIKTHIPDLFVLDIMLPGEDGLSILKRLRTQESTSNVPVIMLTAKSSELDKVKGLDLGADDYIAKPFGVLEFVSRVKALLRRSGMVNVEAAEPKIISLGDVSLDEAKHVVTAGSENVELTYKEYELLKLLVSHPGLVYSRQQLLEKIWGIDFKMDTRTVDMHVKTLRQKLGERGAIIQTVRNVGYKAQ